MQVEAETDPPERYSSVRVSQRTAGRIRKTIRAMREPEKALPTANEIIIEALNALDEQRAAQQNNTELLDLIVTEVSS
jgi:hypothetical protein